MGRCSNRHAWTARWIITASRDGKVAMIRPGAQWEVMSVGDFGEEIWATPAAADRQLFYPHAKDTLLLRDSKSIGARSIPTV